jgi:hypothetical protein
MTPCRLVHGDSLRQDSELLTTNHVITNRRKLNLESTYLGRCWNWFPCAWRYSPTRRSLLANVAASVEAGHHRLKARARTDQAVLHIIAWFIIINSRPPLSESFRRRLPTFRKQMLIPFSGSQNKAGQQPASRGSFTCCVLLACWHILLFDYEDGGFTFLRNVVKLRADYMTSYIGR